MTVTTTSVCDIYKDWYSVIFPLLYYRSPRQGEKHIELYLISTDFLRVDSYKCVLDWIIIVCVVKVHNKLYIIINEEIEIEVLIFHQTIEIDKTDVIFNYFILL